ncbi:MAG: hypothetical protein LBN32_01305 [Helicobacteraceae bacterium]|jgi:type II secretory pathway pseudopilin PulG|nr:hypothetical protein [Helicobacteraceae bacterium]
MRSAFTLIELMISVLLIFLLVFFLASNSSSLKTTATQAERYEKEERAIDELSAMLTRDLLQAVRISVEFGRDYDTLFIDSTRNSLYGRSQAYVIYTVLKDSGSLLRIEADMKIPLPLTSTHDTYRSDFLALDVPIRTFKAQKSSSIKSESGASGCAALIFVEFDDTKDPLLMEIGMLNASACG